MSYAKKPKGHAKPPALKILSIDLSPHPFAPPSPPLTFTITIELPPVVPEDAILDVSTLVTSASKSTFRLLTSQQALQSTHTGEDDPAPPVPSQLEIVHTWDGSDNNDRIAPEGTYDFQVQAKLMVMNNAGQPITRMTAWKKHGKFEIKSQ